MGADNSEFRELLPGMQPGAYGAGFAEVYDSWYDDEDTDAFVDLLATFVGDARVLELGVGTGRIAIPLASRVAPTEIVGLDASMEMLSTLKVKDVGRLVSVVHGDMVDDLPDGPFGLVYASHNTLLNLPTLTQQRDCFRRVADRLLSGGRFVVDAFVPPSGPEVIESIEEVKVRSMTADQVVLSVARYDPDQRVAAGQFVDLRDGELPRLRPWRVRYSTVTELDHAAAESELVVEHRWADANRTPFSISASRHLTVYQRRSDTAD